MLGKEQAELQQALQLNQRQAFIDHPLDQRTERKRRRREVPAQQLLLAVPEEGHRGPKLAHQIKRPVTLQELHGQDVPQATSHQRTFHPQGEINQNVELILGPGDQGHPAHDQGGGTCPV